MKIKKRITIVADIICGEDFDCNELLIAQDIAAHQLSESVYVGIGIDGEWEVIDYLFQEDITLSDRVT